MSEPIVTVVDKGNIWIVDNVFTEDECNKFIEMSEKIGYSEAGITVGQDKYVMMTDIRNNTRVIKDDVDLAKFIFKRLEPYIPKDLDELLPNQPKHELVGLNERFRFYKYVKGQYFASHHDGSYRRQDKIITNEKNEMVRVREESVFTVLIYLNNVENGGATNFLQGHDEKVTYSCKPKIGRVLFFVHFNLHEGEVLYDKKETKYVLRTDVMYKSERKM
ncbi:hypothetical protein ABK040_014950 [Willaertia magna]